MKKYMQGWRAIKHAALSPLIKDIKQFHDCKSLLPDSGCSDCSKFADWEDAMPLYQNEIERAWSEIMEDVPLAIR